MITVNIKATGALLTAKQPVVTSGSLGTVRVQFEFDAEWQGLAKTAVFCTSRGNVLCVLERGGCELPGEVLSLAGDVKVGVFGTDGTRTLTSLMCKVKISHGTPTDAERAQNYAVGIYEQLSAKIERIENMSVTVERGEEAAAQISNEGGVVTLHLTLPKGDKGDKGDAGDKGESGADGYTPVRGKDYWTDADIAQIKAYVDGAILGGEW